MINNLVRMLLYIYIFSSLEDMAMGEKTKKKKKKKQRKILGM